MAGSPASGAQQAVLWGCADQPTVAAHGSALQKAVSVPGEEGAEGSWEQGAGEDRTWEGIGKEDWMTSWIDG